MKTVPWVECLGGGTYRSGTPAGAGRGGCSVRREGGSLGGMLAEGKSGGGWCSRPSGETPAPVCTLVLASSFFEIYNYVKYGGYNGAMRACFTLFGAPIWRFDECAPHAFANLTRMCREKGFILKGPEKYACGTRYSWCFNSKLGRSQ